MASSDWSKVHRRFKWKSSERPIEPIEHLGVESRAIFWSSSNRRLNEEPINFWGFFKIKTEYDNSNLAKSYSWWCFVKKTHRCSKSTVLIRNDYDWHCPSQFQTQQRLSEFSSSSSGAWAKLVKINNCKIETSAGCKNQWNIKNYKEMAGPYDMSICPTHLLKCSSMLQLRICNAGHDAIFAPWPPSRPVVCMDWRWCMGSRRRHPSRS